MTVTQSDAAHLKVKHNTRIYHVRCQWCYTEIAQV